MNAVAKAIINKLTQHRLLGLALLCAYFTSQVAYSQDLQFSQQHWAPLSLNPALAGESNKVRAIFLSRSQWKSVGTPIKSNAASVDMILSKQPKLSLMKSRMAAGISMTNDKFGPSGINHFRVNTAFAYHVQLSKMSVLAGGLDIGFNQLTFAQADGKWGSQWDGYQYDSSIGSGEAITANKEYTMDFGAGVTFHSISPAKKRKWSIDNSLTAGIAGYHLGKIQLSEKESLTVNQGPRYSAFAESEFGMGKNVGLSPAIYAHYQLMNYQVILGTKLKYIVNNGDSFINPSKPIALALGAFVRTNDSVILSLEGNWSDYAMILSYDFNYAGLNQESSGRGAFEIGLKWGFDGKN